MFCWYSTGPLPDRSANGIWRSCARNLLSLKNGRLAWLWSVPRMPARLRAYFQEHDLPFIGLPDPTASVLRLYGQEVNLFKLGRMPAQVIVDKEGMARFVHYGHSMADIPDNSELLELLDTIDDQEITEKV